MSLLGGDFGFDLMIYSRLAFSLLSIGVEIGECSM